MRPLIRSDAVTNAAQTRPGPVTRQWAGKKKIENGRKEGRKEERNQKTGLLTNRAEERWKKMKDKGRGIFFFLVEK